MRRSALLAPVLVLALLLLAQGAALAQQITCTGNPCEGTGGGDYLIGTPNRDRIFAKGGVDTAGDDTLFGGRRGDGLYGGDGDDELFGDEGNDLLLGDRDDEALYGEEGNDDISDVAGPANGDPADVDQLHGGPGDDTLDARDGDGLDTLCTGRGQDRVGTDPGDRLNSRSCSVSGT